MARQQRYLTAVAELSDAAEPVTGAAVAKRLQRTAQQMSGTRDALLKAGTLSATRDELRFAIPGMGRFVLDRARSRDLSR